jgi:hypothetical protein
VEVVIVGDVIVTTAVISLVVIVIRLKSNTVVNEVAVSQLVPPRSQEVEISVDTDVSDAVSTSSRSVPGETDSLALALGVTVVVVMKSVSVEVVAITTVCVGRLVGRTLVPGSELDCDVCEVTTVDRSAIRNTGNGFILKDRASILSRRRVYEDSGRFWGSLA